MIELLFKYQDLKYKDFHSKLMPTVNLETIIGVRVPVLRKIAKEISGSKKSSDFLNRLPHKYYEENNLHAFLLESIKEYDLCIKEVNRFLPYVDNWATCDGMRPKCFAKNTDKLLLEIENWLESDHAYTVRYAIGMLMVHYLDAEFNENYLNMVSSVKSDEYYVNMMLAWYFATALAKQWESTIPYIEQNRLPAWVHNKTIQKAVESYRITGEQKNYLRKLKI
ncbi:MAG: DNA alkylation repair protein [Clostridia bacterium]|nr:DNA alkylation repair protein [Clostridia bacterium]